MNDGIKDKTIISTWDAIGEGVNSLWFFTNSLNLSDFRGVQTLDLADYGVFTYQDSCFH